MFRNSNQNYVYIRIIIAMAVMSMLLCSIGCDNTKTDIPETLSSETWSVNSSVATPDSSEEITEEYAETHSINPDSVFDGLLICNTPLSSFGLSYPEDDKTAVAVYSEIISLFYQKCGEKIDSSVSSEHNIILSTSGNNGSGNVLTIYVNDGNLYISGNPRIGLYRGVRDLFEDIETAAYTSYQKHGDTLVLGKDFRYEKDYGKFVTYEDFGAVGDGKTSDINAIVKAHSEGMRKKLPVLACEIATYYIDGTKNTATIGSNTDWSVAHFIIDDRSVSSAGTEVFSIKTLNSANKINVKSLKAGQTNIGVKFSSPVFVSIENSNVKQFIRYGANQNDGSSMADVILVDENGNVDPTTPILWDFDTITKITATEIEKDTLTLKGGYITTIANKATTTGYYSRGIRITRSNVVIDGLHHFITEEGANGAPYNGIIFGGQCADITIKNSVFTGHKTYYKIGNAGTKVSMGSYDINVAGMINLTLQNCTQTNDINNSVYWGVFASNKSKNIRFDGVKFSRFDAHQGVSNVTLVNSEFGHQGINLIGHGLATIENCTVYSQRFITLRTDYGSTWNGDLHIKNCIFIPKNGEKCDAVIITGTNTDSHYFGYQCYLPQNIIIDGLDIRDKNRASQNPPYLFSNINTKWTSANYNPQYPTVLPKSIVVSNITTASGKKLEISPNKVMFKEVTIDYKN